MLYGDYRHSGILAECCNVSDKQTKPLNLGRNFSETETGPWLQLETLACEDTKGVTAQSVHFPFSGSYKLQLVKQRLIFF